TPSPTFFLARAPPALYTLSLHDALPILRPDRDEGAHGATAARLGTVRDAAAGADDEVRFAPAGEVAQAAVRIAWDGLDRAAPLGDQLTDHVEEVRSQPAHQHGLPRRQIGVLPFGGHAGWGVAQREALGEPGQRRDLRVRLGLDHPLGE